MPSSTHQLIISTALYNTCIVLAECLGSVRRDGLHSACCPDVSRSAAQLGSQPGRDVFAPTPLHEDEGLGESPKSKTTSAHDEICGMLHKTHGDHTSNGMFQDDNSLVSKPVT